MPRSRPVHTAPHGEPAKSIGSIVNDLARQFKVSFDRQAHSLGLKVIIDQVISHSSDKHALFILAALVRNPPYT